MKRCVWGIVFSLFFSQNAYTEGYQHCKELIGIPSAKEGGDHGRKIINMSEAKSLQASEKGDHYKVIDSEQFILGMSLTEMTLIPGMVQFLPILGQLFGILPMIGYKAHSERHVQSEEDAENLDAPRIPKSIEELEAWAVNDFVQYSLLGGLSVYIGIDSPLIGVLLPAIVQGEWGYTVKKLDHDNYLLAVERAKAYGVRGKVGNFFIKDSLGWMNQMQKTYAFKIDMRAEGARIAFPKFIKGYLSDLQKAAQEKEPWITEVEAIKENLVQKSMQFRVCIPLVIGKAWDSSYGEKEFGFVDENPEYAEKWENTCTDSTCLQNIFDKRNQLNYYKNVYKGKKITARVYHTDFESDGSEQEIEMTWTYRNNIANTQSFKKGMKKLFEFTGMQNSLERVWRGEDRLNYFGIRFQMLTDGSRLKNLLEKEDFVSVQLGIKGDQLVKDYFHIQKDPHSLCKESLLISEETCIQNYKNETTMSLLNLQAKVMEYSARTFEKQDDLLDFLLQIGNLIFKNPFTIQSVLSFAGNEIPLTYTLEGQKFKIMKLTGKELGIY